MSNWNFNALMILFTMIAYHHSTCGFLWSFRGNSAIVQSSSKSEVASSSSSDNTRESHSHWNRHRFSMRMCSHSQEVHIGDRIFTTMTECFLVVDHINRYTAENRFEVEINRVLRCYQLPLESYDLSGNVNISRVFYCSSYGNTRL